MSMHPPKGMIRLTCFDCDRDDCDPVIMEDAMSQGWVAIVEAAQPPWEHDRSDWWTHVGWCHECKDHLYESERVEGT